MTFDKSSPFHVDNEKASFIAGDKADKEVELCFPKDQRDSDPANRLWLLVYWREFHSLVQP